MIVNMASHCHTNSAGTEAGDMHEACRQLISGKSCSESAYISITQNQTPDFAEQDQIL